MPYHLRRIVRTSVSWRRRCILLVVHDWWYLTEAIGSVRALIPKRWFWSHTRHGVSSQIRVIILATSHLHGLIGVIWHIGLTLRLMMLEAVGSLIIIPDKISYQPAINWCFALLQSLCAVLPCIVNDRSLLMLLGILEVRSLTPPFLINQSLLLHLGLRGFSCR